MRTNIEIDDALMRQAMLATNSKTKREAVEKALEGAVALSAQRQLRELRGIGWEGDLDATRLDG